MTVGPARTESSVNKTQHCLYVGVRRVQTTKPHLPAVYPQYHFPYLCDESKGKKQLFAGPLSYAKDVSVDFVCVISLNLKVKVTILIVINLYIITIGRVLTF